jgi:hypothetical protein
LRPLPRLNASEHNLKSSDQSNVTRVVIENIYEGIAPPKEAEKVSAPAAQRASGAIHPGMTELRMAPMPFKL